MSVNAVEYGAAKAAFEVRIAATPERVWAALVDETSAWWSKDFYYRPWAQGFVIEARPGGSVYEDWGDGDGFVWYSVTAIRKNRLLRLSGELDISYGPGHIIEQFELEADGEETIVRFTEQLFGNATEKGIKSLEDGWRLLLGECLKPYVEGAAA